MTLKDRPVEKKPYLRKSDLVTWDPVGRLGTDPSELFRIPLVFTACLSEIELFLKIRRPIIQCSSAEAFINSHGL